MPLTVSSRSESALPLRAVLAVIAVVLTGVVVATVSIVTAVGAVNRKAESARAAMANVQRADYRPVANVVQQQVKPVLLGDWTPDRSRLIAERALHWLNWPYSFGGGGEDGPSFGVAVDKDSRHDPEVYGFDCSGLVMFAMAPYRHLDHSAAKQYSEVGSYHPPLDTLQVGDLIFWSKDGSIDSIGHVAVYIGNGNVVQAPESGDVIKVTPMYRVESGYIGATRPLT
ncbi:MAG TPA: NlpC/P60 family protein [Jatrophihabitantaceae bacterium]|nr:NlpC/P60 family protein [Jatrophihabitantaceae bacterium]